MTQILVDIGKIRAVIINAHPIEYVLAIVTACVLASLITIAVLCSRDPSAARERVDVPAPPEDWTPW